MSIKHQTLKRLAETQSPEFIAGIANFMSGRKRFYSLGWNGVLEVSSNGTVYGAKDYWQSSLGDASFVPNLDYESRELTLT